MPQPTSRVTVQRKEPVSAAKFNTIADQAFRATNWDVDTSTGLTFATGPDGFKLGLIPTELAWLGYTTTQVDKISGNVPGSGTVSLCTVFGQVGVAFHETGLTESAINGTPGNIPAKRYCGGIYFEGVAVITWAVCSSTDQPPPVAASQSYQSPQPMTTDDGQPITDEQGEPISNG